MNNKVDRSFIKDRLYALMTEKNITISELANISGVPSTTISNILREKSANITALKNLANSLNINHEYLLEKDCAKKELNIDIELYGKCTSIVIKALKRAKIQAQPNSIKLLQDELYSAHTNLNIPLIQGEVFVLGIIQYGLSIGTFIKES